MSFGPRAALKAHVKRLVQNYLPAVVSSSLRVTECIRQHLAPTFTILGLNTSWAFDRTSRTTSPAGIEAYFFLRSAFPVEEKEPGPCIGSKMPFLIFLSRSMVSSSSSFWMTSLACSKRPCSNRLALIRLFRGDTNHSFN